MRIYMRFVFTMVVGLFALSTVAQSEAGTITFKATATLFEPYGTIPSGDTLTVVFSIDDASGLAISTQVSHATEGSLSSTSTPLETNVFNNAFGNTIDAIAIGGGPNPNGMLGGIAPGSAIVNHIVIDLRGDTSILTSTNTPTDLATWNAFTQRTLALPAPSNPNATTAVATIGNFLVNPPQAAQFFAYVTNISSGNISVIDTSTNTEVLPRIPVGSAPIAVAITPNAAFAYVVNLATDNVSVIDTSTNTVVATVSVGDSPEGVAITPNGAFAYVTNALSNTVSVIDTSTNTVVATVPVGNIPVGVAITPDGAFAYVVNNLPGSVSVIDTSTNTVVATVPVPTNPQDVDITPDGAFAYVTGPSFDNVSVINTATNTVVAVVAVGDLPREVAITPDGAFAYVTNALSDNVSVIDTSTNTVVATVPVGDQPQGVAITPDGAFAYVMNTNSQNVSVIDIFTNTEVLPKIALSGGQPFAVAITPRRRLVVTNTNDSGPGSLRQTILDARGDGVPSIITFDPAVFPNTINLQSRLPVMNAAGDWIDGSGRGVTVNGSNLSLSSDHGLRVQTNNVTIRGLTIQNFPGSGIRIQSNPNAPTGSSDQVLTGIVVSNNIVAKNLDGVVLAGGQSNNQFEVSITGNTLTQNSSDGIVVNGSDSTGDGGNVIDVTISNNSINGSAGSDNVLAGDGIRVLGGLGDNAGNNVIRALISDNLSRNNFGEGIRVAGAGTGSSSSNNQIDATITGNTTGSNGATGITISGGPTITVPATTSGNAIRFLADSNQSLKNTGNGIAILGNAGSSHVVRGTISNNEFGANSAFGISLQGRGSFNTLENIDIQFNQITRNGDRGLVIFGGDSGNTDNAAITNVLVNGNTITQNGHHGLVADLGTGVGNSISFDGITNNVTSNNGAHGIIIAAGIDGNGAPISGNRADRNRNTNRDGININSTGYVLSGNRAEANARFGIRALGNTDGGGNISRRNGDASCDPSGCF